MTKLTKEELDNKIKTILENKKLKQLIKKHNLNEEKIILDNLGEEKEIILKNVYIKQGKNVEKIKKITLDKLLEKLNDKEEILTKNAEQNVLTKIIDKIVK